MIYEVFCHDSDPPRIRFREKNNKNEDLRSRRGIVKEWNKKREKQGARETCRRMSRGRRKETRKSVCTRLTIAIDSSFKTYSKKTRRDELAQTIPP